jgi:hypothetical protein
MTRPCSSTLRSPVGCNRLGIKYGWDLDDIEQWLSEPEEEAP